MTDGMDPHSRSTDAVEQGRPVEAQYARQGRKGSRVFLVLAVSVVLAALAVFAVWALNAGRLGSTEPHNARQGTDAQSFDTPAAGAFQTQAQDPTAAERGSTVGEQLPRGGQDVPGEIQAEKMRDAQMDAPGAVPNATSEPEL